MPRDGSGNYTLPYPAVVDGTTIESAVHNGTMSDIALQLNGPLPIIAGGTGANNAHDAMVNLSGEISGQGDVRNYDTFPFVGGSFWSSPGATNEPVAGEYFSGICYVINPTSLTLEGRVGSTGQKWFRKKYGTVWDAGWTAQAGSVADLDARYVNVTGDTMSGPLLVTPKGSVFGGPAGTASTGAVTPADANIIFYNGGATNWAGMGTDTNGDVWFKTGISGTPAPVLRLTNDGQQVAVQSAAASTSPATGALTVAGGVGVAGTLNSGPQVIWAASNPTLNFLENSAVAVTITASGVTSYLDYGTSLVIRNRPGSYVTNLSMHAGGTAIPLTTPSTSPTTGALTVAGGVGIGGAIISGVKGSTFGVPGGTGASAGVANTDANILLYNNSAVNWAGLGVDGGGNAWIRTGLSGSPAPAIWFSASDQSNHIQSTTASTSPTTGALVVGGGIGAAGDISARGFNAERGDGSYQYKLTYPGIRQWGLAIESVAGAFCIDDLTGAQRKFTVSTLGITSTNGYLSRAGTPGGNGAVAFNLNWNGSTAFHLWADATNLGNISVTSDYRIKKDVIDLPGMWDTVKALRPIKYTQAQFTPPSHIEYKVKAAAEEAKVQRKLAEDSGKTYEAKPAEEIQPLFPADDIERWGFIAHELQGTLLPTAAEGVKDAPDTIQSINLAPVVAALTKALQEAMTRIEALEAR